MWVAIVMALLALALASPVHAQSFSTADLAGSWAFFQLATPTTSFNGNGSSIVSFNGVLTFDSAGNAGGTLSGGGLSGAGISSGSFSVAVDGSVQGAFSCCDDPDGDFVSTGARMLTNKHTIVGTATIFGQVGFFNLVKLEGGQTFDVTDVAGDTQLDWSYHELTPSNDLTRTGTDSTGDAAWVNGSITFHNSGGCTEADLTLPDGTIRARRADGSTSYG
jgi:hypothetical protein